jgi:hypothetical protein
MKGISFASEFHTPDLLLVKIHFLLFAVAPLIVQIYTHAIYLRYSSSPWSQPG